MRDNKKCLVLVQAVCLCALAGSAAAENIFSVSSASPHPRAGELRLNAGVGLALPGSRETPDAQAGASSYGLRFSHYPERHPNWGVGVDFTRYGSGNGIQARDAEQALFRDALAPATTPLDRAAQRFDQPQNVNVLSVSGIYRWHGEGPAVGRLQPYVGLGLAWYRSNTDGTTPGFSRPPTQEGSALGYHMLGGVRYHFTERAGAFFEAKFNSGNPLNAYPGDADGSSRSYHAVAGVSYSF